MHTTTLGRWRAAAAALIVLAALGLAAPAAAQTREGEQAPPPAPTAPAAGKSTGPRVFISGDVGYQMASSGYGLDGSFTLYTEKASFSADVPDGGGGLAFAFRGGFRVAKNFLIGVGATGFSAKQSADVSASLPHPFFFNRPRTVTGTSGNLTRKETMIAVEAAWRVPMSPKLDLQLFGGPAFFKVKADMPTGVTFTETYPYDTATFSGVTTTSVSDSATGFTVGADVAFLFTPSIGVGGQVRFSRATGSLSAAGVQTEIDLGGAQAFGGLRFRF